LTEYIIEISGISQAVKDSNPSFEINTFSGDGDGQIGSTTTSPFTTIAGGTDRCIITELKSQFSTPSVRNYLKFQIFCDDVRKTSTLYLKMSLLQYSTSYLSGLASGASFKYCTVSGLFASGVDVCYFDQQ